MTTYYKPVGTPVTYPALRSRCGNRLPDDFFAWRMLENAERRRLVAEGHHVIGLPVMPADLDRFCRTNRCRADSAAIAAMVAWRGAEIYGTQADYEAYRASLVVVEDVRAERGPEIVEAGPGVVRKRPWWAFWRPKYQVTDVSVAQLEADAAARRQPGRAFWRRPTYSAADAGVAPSRPTPMLALPRRRPWWAFWRRDTPAVPAE